MDEEEKVLAPHCFNCNAALEPNDKFCPQCGQKNHTGKVPFSELVHEFFHTFTHLDNTFFRTFRDIWVPAKLSLKFFEGKRKSYLNPFRLFFVTALFYIAALAISTKEYTEIAKQTMVTVRTTATNIQSLRYLDTLSNNLEKVYPDSSIQKILDTIKVEMLKYYKLPIYDSIQGDSSRIVSFYQLVDAAQNADDNSVAIDFTGPQMRALSINDAFVAEPDTILSRLGIEGFWDKKFYRQAIKLLRDGSDLVDYLIHKLSWAFIFLLPILGFFMSLLYTKQKRYYVENLVFLSHFHSFAYIIFGLLLLSWQYWSFAVAVGSFLLILLYLWIAMKRYYKQTFWTTTFKFTVFGLIYLTLGSALTLSILLLSLFIY